MQELVRQGGVVTLIAWTDLIDLVARESGEEVQYIDATQSRFDVLVLRTTWDYWDRLEEFRAFLEGCVVEDEAQLFNKAKSVLANLDKSYLLELQSVGVPIVPTIIVEEGREEAAINDAVARGWSALVIKPTVAAAAVGLKKFDAPDGEALAYLRELTKAGGALVQPFLPRVVSEGETSLVYFDNVFSHAVTKVPAAGDFRSQVDFGGAYTLVEPTAAQQAAAQRVLAAWERRYGEQPLYARVDLVPGDDGTPLLGELELIEPELFLDMAEDAAATFASAILARVVEHEQPPAPWWKTALAGIGCLVASVAAAIIVVTGVITLLGWLFGGP